LDFYLVVNTKEKLYDYSLTEKMAEEILEEFGLANKLEKK